MNSSLKLAFEEILRRLDDIDTRIERRFSKTWGARDEQDATVEPFVGIHELCSAVQFEAPVEADNWGGLFEQLTHASEERDLNLSDVVFTGLSSVIQIHDEKILPSSDNEELEAVDTDPIAQQEAKRSRSLVVRTEQERRIAIVRAGVLGSSSRVDLLAPG